MITTATINIDDRVKKAGQQVAKEMGLRGKFSEYIELLIKADLKSKKIIIGRPNGSANRLEHKQ